MTSGAKDGLAFAWCRASWGPPRRSKQLHGPLTRCSSARLRAAWASPRDVAQFARLMWTDDEIGPLLVLPRHARAYLAPQKVPKPATRKSWDCSKSFHCRSPGTAPRPILPPPTPETSFVALIHPLGASTPARHKKDRALAIKYDCAVTIRGASPGPRLRAAPTNTGRTPPDVRKKMCTHEQGLSSSRRFRRGSAPISLHSTPLKSAPRWSSRARPRRSEPCSNPFSTSPSTDLASTRSSPSPAATFAALGPRTPFCSRSTPRRAPS